MAAPLGNQFAKMRQTVGKRCPPGCTCKRHNRTEMIGNKRGVGSGGYKFPTGPWHPLWKGDDAKPGHVARGRGNARAQRMYPLDGVICEKCGKRPAAERHHKDRDTYNNKRSNVDLLCKACHRAEHKREVVA